MTTIMSMDLREPSTSNPNFHPSPSLTPTPAPTTSQHASENPSHTAPYTWFGSPQTTTTSTSIAFPFKGSHHRRAISEVTFRIPDDIFDPFYVSSVPSMEEIGSDDDLFSKYIDVEKLSGIGGTGDGGGDEGEKDDGGNGCERKEDGKFVRPRSRHLHRHNETVKSKKAMPANMLAELWVVDPKRAKRILANRQSAARSKERKARYIVELEKKVQALDTEATTLATQVTLYQRDVTDLASENTELNLQLQTMEQQIQLRIDLNEALRREVERLRVVTGEIKTPSSTSLNLEVHQMSPSPYLQLPQSPLPPVGLHNNIKLSLLPGSPYTMSSRHLHPANPQQPISEYVQNDPLLCYSQGLDINSSGHLVKVESPSSESTSTIILTPTSS